eukprot:NODE_2307_length_1236_cov_27.777591_g2102_i0.p1 GENE.NODE_2307_length_1236_cov_27.777591_g2102_i0~~NODE_2307_length_1236_cov_27.777591_g2102_i0.p1  ORF type:complete len:334 (-),score=38.23 NODE_2307_length_1236_cov_27.777591_g2102_i0:130-1131(-)
MRLACNVTLAIATLAASLACLAYCLISLMEARHRDQGRLRRGKQLILLLGSFGIGCDAVMFLAEALRSGNTSRDLAWLYLAGPHYLFACAISVWALRLPCSNKYSLAHPVIRGFGFFGAIVMLPCAALIEYWWLVDYCSGTLAHVVVIVTLLSIAYWDSSLENLGSLASIVLPIILRARRTCVFVIFLFALGDVFHAADILPTPFVCSERAQVCSLCLAGALAGGFGRWLPILLVVRTFAATQLFLVLSPTDSRHSSLINPSLPSTGGTPQTMDLERFSDGRWSLRDPTLAEWNRASTGHFAHEDCESFGDNERASLCSPAINPSYAATIAHV